MRLIRPGGCWKPGGREAAAGKSVKLQLAIALAVLVSMPLSAIAGPVGIQDKKPLRAGNASTLVTDDVVEEITVTYSPSSNVAQTEVVKANGTKLVLWRPQRPGVVSIAAPGHEPKTHSVRFDGVPLSGVIIMMLAGFILFGGAFISLRALLAGGSKS